MPDDVSIEVQEPTSGTAHERWQAGLTALAANDHAAARRHLEAALEFHPAAPAILLDMVSACADAPELLPIWLDAFTASTVGARGRVEIDAASKRRLQAIPAADLKAAQQLAERRFEAIRELQRFIDKHKAARRDNPQRALLVRWASELLLEVAQDMPSALRTVAPAVAKVQGGFTPDHDAVYQGLRRIAQQAPATDGPTADSPAVDEVERQRVRAARILVGFARQAGLKDLRGFPPVSPGRFADDAQRVLGTQRENMLASARIWTVEELSAMTPAQAVAFTDEHAHWDRPAVAHSPKRLYRIETVCGHQTLLEAARTVEQHHARLAAHFGSDPFAKRQGVVRIVPENHDLEIEGTPYWWANGFQAGDVTTVRFAWSDVQTLGRSLTHELTHRFDGVLRPFTPAWHGEGHAEWTEGNYVRIADTQFVENHLKHYTVAMTHYKGYGYEEEFAQLLTGEIDDYRDNYIAGYSLYAFLASYPPGAPRYRSALQKFESNARAGLKDPVGFFAATFCDGKEGRPESLDGFREQWQEFLEGCYRYQDDPRQAPSWTTDYVRLGDGEKYQQVLDVPTRSWARLRAEPYFGQDHAAAATQLLHEVGDVDGTIAAGVWSLSADGWRPEVTRALLAALGVRPADAMTQLASEAFTTTAHARFPGIEAPAATSLAGALPKTNELLNELSARAMELDQQGLGAATAATAERHRRLARWCGVPALAKPEHAAPLPLPRHLGARGFAESGLTDYEESRVPGLWYVAPDGDLHVGREKPRDGTGTLDRAAQRRDAFAHAVECVAAGHYVLRGRVHLTTSYVSGAIVLGYNRRDRNVRLSFSSGDFGYATGKTESVRRGNDVTFSLGGLWERDDELRQEHHGRVELPDGQHWFEYTIVVRGPRAVVSIDDVEVRYASHDGAPIEGLVGFALDAGAIRVQQPTVQRLENDGPEASFGLDVTRPAIGSVSDLLQLRTSGVPLHRSGTLLLWLPASEDGVSPGFRIESHRMLKQLFQQTHEYPQSWVLAVPRGIEAKHLADAQRAIELAKGDKMPVIQHSVAAPLTGTYPWVLFIDDAGVLRAASSIGHRDLRGRVMPWAQMFRSRL